MTGGLPGGGTIFNLFNHRVFKKTGKIYVSSSSSACSTASTQSDDEMHATDHRDPAPANAASAVWPPNEPVAMPPPSKGCRTAVMIVSFVAFFEVHALRACLGVVLVSMTRQPWVARSTSATASASNSTAQQSVFCRDTVMVRQKQSYAPFQWDLNTQGLVLAAFFFGYIITQAPGRILTRKRGGKCVMLAALLIMTLLAFITPVLTRYADFGALAGIRAIDGLVQGLTYPAMYAILSKWAPPLERSTMVTVIYAGSQVGTILAMPISGLIAHYIGWDFVFYLFGVIGVVCCSIWLYCVHDSPSVHPRIDYDELEYIETSLRQQTITTGREHTSIAIAAADAEEPSARVPWEEIFRSMPVYATAVSHFASNWTHYTMLTCLPLYLHSVLRFNVHIVGLLCALPFAAMWTVMVLGGRLANVLLIKRILSTSTVRQLFNTIGFLFPAVCLLVLSFTGCNALLSIVLITVSVGLSGLSTSGWAANHLDLAPPLAVELVAITNLIGTIPGIIAPFVVAAFIEYSRPRDAWRYVFLVSTGVYVIGTVFFWVYGSAERQWWSYPLPSPPNDEKTPSNRPPTIVHSPSVGDRATDRDLDTDVPESMAIRTDDGTEQYDPYDPYAVGPVQTFSDIGCAPSSRSCADDSGFPSRRQSF